MSAATASSAASVRPATITFNPSVANRLQSWAPNPRSGPTPITIAVFIARSELEIPGRSHRSSQLRAAGQSRGVADCGAAVRHIARYDGCGTDLGEIADPDIAENSRAGADEDAATDPWRARGKFTAAA